jgi:DNA (cytosine-5)-methyltransferase 1
MKPVLLDLFCGAGGAGMGYREAGFHIVGIDIKDQPRYPGDFIQTDVMNLRRLDKFARLIGAVAIHASPPCQHFSTASGKAKKHHGASYPDLIPATRDALVRTGLPYVIENVEFARQALVNPVRYCGSSFGLDIRRHRLFESNVDLIAPACNHDWQTPRFRSLDSRIVAAGRLASVVGVHGNCNYAGEFPIRCAAMGIGWMTNAELVEAIPPVYTRHVGTQLLMQLSNQEAAA